MNLGTIYIDGKPVASMTDMQTGSIATSKPVLVYPPRNYSVEFTCTVPADFDEIARMFAVARHPAAKPQGIATIPFGILGPLQLPGTIEDVGESANGVHLEFGTAAWDRVLAMAVERAITNEYERDRVVVRALDLRSPMVDQMAHRMGFSRPGGCYRGERKQRRAMRRLLRAAGITRREA